jgi:hypothetical protein
MINYKMFGKKWSWRHRGTYLLTLTEETHERLSQDRQNPGRGDSNPAPSEQKSGELPVHEPAR